MYVVGRAAESPLADGMGSTPVHRCQRRRSLVLRLLPDVIGRGEHFSH